jgi:hypothetical protein
MRLQADNEAFQQAFGTRREVTWAQEIIFFERGANRALQALAGDPGAAIAAELTFFGRIHVVAIEIRWGEVLEDMEFDQHAVLSFQDGSDTTEGGR